MPELPEVETTLRGIAPHVVGQCIVTVEVRERRLRWPVPRAVDELAGCRISAASRRGKYLLLEVEGQGTLILHLGMSGSLRLVNPNVEWRRHDHLAIRLASGRELRLHDPRRFGCVLFTRGDPQRHKLLRELGPEPLGETFDADCLATAARGRKVAIKQCIMNSHVVVGVWATSTPVRRCLWRASTRPGRRGVFLARAWRLWWRRSARCWGRRLSRGGTTLRDFLHEDGKPGYFKQSLRVYDREGEPCRVCGGPVRRAVQGGRSTFYCPQCQR